MPSLTAAYQPQEWVSDFAMDSGPAVEFDAGPGLLGLGPMSFAYHVAQARRPAGRDLDRLAAYAGIWHEGASGHVSLSVADLEAFLEELGLSDVPSVTDDMLAQAREYLAQGSPSP